MIACPTCTFHNSIQLTNCELCDNALFKWWIYTLNCEYLHMITGWLVVSGPFRSRIVWLFGFFRPWLFAQHRFSWWVRWCFRSGGWSCRFGCWGWSWLIFFSGRSWLLRLAYRSWRLRGGSPFLWERVSSSFVVRRDCFWFGWVAALSYRTGCISALLLQFSSAIFGVQIAFLWLKLFKNRFNFQQ